MKQTRSRITFDELTEVKHQLPISDKLVTIGYSVESLRKNEYIYEVHETNSGRKSASGRINIFGATFLSGFVRYKNNTFINLISISGRKAIELHDFQHGLRSQLVRSIDYKDFQLKPSRERYGLFYSNGTIMLAELTESPPLVNILIRTWQGQALGPTYRIVSFDSIPRMYFNCHGLWLLNQGEFTNLSLKCQPQYMQLQNWESIRVVEVHQLFIVTFGDSSDYFCLNKAGRVTELAQNVRALATHEGYLGLITQPSQFAKAFLLLEYDHQKGRYQQREQLSIPVQCKNSLCFEQWIKIDLDNAQDPSRKEFIRIDLNVDSNHRLTKACL